MRANKSYRGVIQHIQEGDGVAHLLQVLVDVRLQRRIGADVEQLAVEQAEHSLRAVVGARKLGRWWHGTKELHHVRAQHGTDLEIERRDALVDHERKVVSSNDSVQRSHVLDTDVTARSVKDGSIRRVESLHNSNSHKFVLVLVSALE